MTATTVPAAPTLDVGTDSDLSVRQAARIAGVGYVLLFALAIFANFFVREGLIVADDAAATATNIAESNGLFRFGLVSFLAIFLIDIVVAWALYIVFRHEQRDLSLVAGWSRVVYTVFLGVAAIFFFQALSIYDSAFIGVVERNAQALIALELFNAAWLIGLAAFGLHLIVLGVVVTRSATAPRLLGFFMMFAGVAYIVDTTAYSLLSNYDDYSGALLLLVSIPSLISEGWLGLWLLFRAGKNEPSSLAAVQEGRATKDLVLQPSHGVHQLRIVDPRMFVR